MSDHDGTHRDVKAAAEARRRDNRFSSKNQPLHKDAEELGIAGAVAFANLCRVRYTPPVKRPKGGKQITMEVGGYTIKTTTSMKGRLNVKADRPLDAQIYVLMWCDGPPHPDNCWCAGWAWREEVLASEIVTPEFGTYTERMHTLGFLQLHRGKELWPILGINPPPPLPMPSGGLLTQRPKTEGGRRLV